MTPNEDEDAVDDNDGNTQESVILHMLALCYYSSRVPTANANIGGRQTMRGTSGREPHIPYQIPNIPYQIWNSMSFLKEYVSRRGTAFHMPS